MFYIIFKKVLKQCFHLFLNKISAVQLCPFYDDFKNDVTLPTFNYFLK
jgi:hypothetical protein